MPLRIPAESSKHLAMNHTGSKVATESNDWEALKGEWRAATGKQIEAICKEIVAEISARSL